MEEMYVYREERKEQRGWKWGNKGERGGRKVREITETSKRIWEGREDEKEDRMRQGQDGNKKIKERG